jgi:hypothetical protein
MSFFARLMKVQTNTPPPQPITVESMASNVAHVCEQTPTMSDYSATILMFKLCVSPQSQIAPQKTTTSTSY